MLTPSPSYTDRARDQGTGSGKLHTGFRLRGKIQKTDSGNKPTSSCRVCIKDARNKRKEV